MMLAEIRKSKKISQEQVATDLGITLRTYQNYEYGEREISAEALYKLANFYGVTTDYLLGRGTTDDETRLNAKYRALSPQGKEAIAKIVNALADAHKTSLTPDDRYIALTTIGEVLTAIGIELSHQ